MCTGTYIVKYKTYMDEDLEGKVITDPLALMETSLRDGALRNPENRVLLMMGQEGKNEARPRT